jgi:putative Holliday junction resolvase
MAIVALDLGKRRIGVAATDASGLAVHPLGTVERRNLKYDLEAIAALVAGREVDRVIVGLPLNMDGSEGPAARTAREFAQQLRTSLGLPVELFDERLTSFEAKERLKQISLRRSKRKPAIDQIAAMVILESWLSRRDQPKR